MGSNQARENLVRVAPSGDRLALTPPTGWMSWNGFGRDLDEAAVIGNADALVRSGLRAQRSDDGASQGIVEIVEIVSDMPERMSGGDELGDGLLTLSDFNIDAVNDPLYQAFVATGLFRPR